MEPVPARVLLLFRGKRQDHQTQMMQIQHEMLNTVTEVKPNAAKARGKQNHFTWEVGERSDHRELQSGF